MGQTSKTNRAMLPKKTSVPIFLARQKLPPGSVAGSWR